ncbi:hypothetical protein CO648_00600 [Rhizobium phaseoli]|uniref:Uncharacterized protein n=1 Tax=Rhizobium etli (strain CIAT 652) TaxID=491916 RepID=B3PXG9_RHIE6|nr:hypothetical protein RHECIAT_CH0000179 [Rhizobium etli CIAT 652]PCD69092.1 hypothetical protein CO648_00600 [Rhizobium phaseoli]
MFPQMRLIPELFGTLFWQIPKNTTASKQSVIVSSAADSHRHCFQTAGSQGIRSIFSGSLT